MAQKKTTSSAGGGARQRPVETARKPAAGAKNTINQPRRTFVPRFDLYRLAAAFVMLFFGIVGVVSWFNREGTLMRAYYTFISAQLGWGYYPMPVCMLLSAWLMGMNKDRPCTGRVVCAMLAALLFGAFVQLAGCTLETLYSLPRLTESGLGYALKQLKNYGQDPVYCCGGIFSGLLGALLYTCLRRVFGCILLIVFIVPLCTHALGGDVRVLLAFVLSLPTRAMNLIKRLQHMGRERWLRYIDDDDNAYFGDDDEYDDDEDSENALYEALRRGKTGTDSEAAGEPAPAVIEDDDIEPQDVSSVPVSKADFRPTQDITEDEFAMLLTKRQRGETGRTENQRRNDRFFDAIGLLDDTPPAKSGNAPFDLATTDLSLDDMPEFTPETEPVPAEKPAPKPAQNARPKKPAAPKAPAEKTEPAPAAEAIPAAAPEEPKDVYQFPPLELLRRGAGGAEGKNETAENQNMLEAAIRSFGVAAEVVGVVRGPSVTRYEMKLAQGVKLSRITNLSGDIALSLGVSSVRIAPIADKISTVGVEVPNRTTQTVWLGDTIDTDTFRKSKSKLSIALGKDIGGNVIVGNIAKMPHVLIAGTTGSGKSVCINSLILSLLYKSTPDEVKLIMVDPKMVELGIYNGLPHMLTPVVTDPKKAAGSLQWAVVEMLKRYRLFSEVGVRDLAGYNAVLQSNDQKIFPQVVIIIDELADLMMTAKKEVEESICRIAQMGRAAGMHLVVATQRPSADVITGLMKANIPSRIAFAVSSGIESRIILDQQGAEKLIGMGDMLYAPIGVGKPVRVQGAFVTDEEREEVINFIKAHCEAEYDDEVTREVEKNAAALDNDGKKKGSDDFASGDTTDAAGEEYDELLPQAVEVIFEVKQASTSMLQRRLKLGYSRAGRLIDQLEQLGVVGPYQGSKPREILMTKQQWQERQYVHGTAPTDSISRELSDIADMQQDDEAEFLEDED